MTGNSGVAATAIARLIALYQRHLSPRKGYSCAHRVLHGGPSCSAYGKRAVLRCGPVRAARLVFRRFARCSAAARQIREVRAGEGQANRDAPAGTEAAGPDKALDRRQRSDPQQDRRKGLGESCMEAACGPGRQDRGCCEAADLGLDVACCLADR